MVRSINTFIYVYRVIFQAAVFFLSLFSKKIFLHRPYSYDSASPFFNYSFDCSLGGFQGNFSVDFNLTPVG